MYEGDIEKNVSSWISDYVPFNYTHENDMEPKIDSCHVYTTPGVKNETSVCSEYVFSTEFFDSTVVTEVNILRY